MEAVGRTLGYEDEHSVRELPRLLGLDAAALPHQQLPAEGDLVEGSLVRVGVLCAPRE